MIHQLSDGTPSPTTTTAAAEEEDEDENMDVTVDDGVDASDTVPRSWATAIRKLMNHLVVQKVFLSVASCCVVLSANQVANPALRAALISGDVVFVLVDLILSLKRQRSAQQ